MNRRHHVMRYKSPYNASEGICGISIFQSAPDIAVVVLTEIEGNTGMSVTNAVEFVADKARRAFLPEIAPEQIVWVERYEKIGSLGRAGEIQFGETFDLVTFKVGQDGSYSSPSWRPLGNRDEESFWKILFQCAPPLERSFPDFLKASEAMTLNRGEA